MDIFFLLLFLFSLSTAYYTFTAEVTLEVYHCVPQIPLSTTPETSDVWRSRGSHRTPSRWPNHTVSALTPPNHPSPRQPEKLTVVKWNTRRSRHLQSLFIQFSADGSRLKESPKCMNTKKYHLTVNPIPYVCFRRRKSLLARSETRRSKSFSVINKKLEPEAV